MHTQLLSHYVEPANIISPSYLHDFTNALFIIQTCKLLLKKVIIFPLQVYMQNSFAHMIFLIVCNGKVNLLICTFGAKVRVDYVFPTQYVHLLFSI